MFMRVYRCIWENTVFAIHSRYIASKQRRIYVNATSRRIDVDTTLFLGCVPVGKALYMYYNISGGISVNGRKLEK